MTYSAKSVAAFAAQSYFQGAAFAVAASLSGLQPFRRWQPRRTASEPRANPPALAWAASEETHRRQATSGQTLPSRKPHDGRGSTLPGPGPGAGGGGVSVSIGQFTTLGTVDDETGAKLAQAIDRVKQDGLA